MSFSHGFSRILCTSASIDLTGCGSLLLSDILASSLWTNVRLEEGLLSSANWLEKFGESALDKDSGVPTEPVLFVANDEKGLSSDSFLKLILFLLLMVAAF